MTNWLSGWDIWRRNWRNFRKFWKSPNLGPSAIVWICGAWNDHLNRDGILYFLAWITFTWKGCRPPITLGKQGTTKLHDRHRKYWIFKISQFSGCGFGWKFAIFQGSHRSFQNPSTSTTLWDLKLFCGYFRPLGMTKKAPARWWNLFYWKIRKKLQIRVFGWFGSFCQIPNFESPPRAGQWSGWSWEAGFRYTYLVSSRRQKS